jgi:glycosyltransferase involved in cell wall biosynthesis
MARALQSAGAEVRIYCLTQGEHYESALDEIGLKPQWVGQFGNPAFRLASLVRALRGFRPHVIHATHSYVNLYAALAARPVGAISIGAIRSSLAHCQTANGRWTRWLMRLPSAVIANSRAALAAIRREHRVDDDRLFLLNNAIDLAEFNGKASQPAPKSAATTAAFVGRLIPSKRLDLFLRALDAAVQRNERLRGVVVGDGPERESMQQLAYQLGLEESRVRFLGRRTDVPRLLQGTDMLVFCSDDEGMPNAVLEAMAAGIPVIATAVGDLASLIQDGVSGFIVPLDDHKAIADRMVRLADCAELRGRLGAAGRQIIESDHSLNALGDRMLSIYGTVARSLGKDRALAALSG